MNNRARTLVVGSVMVVGVGAFLFWPRVEPPAAVAPDEVLVQVPRLVVAPNAAPAEAPATPAAAETVAAAPAVKLVEAAVAPAQAPAAARPAPVAKKRAPSLLGGDFAGGETAGDPAAIDRHLAAHEPAELQLLGILARNEIAAPPALDRLFAMKRAGASEAEQLAFMRRELPADLALRRHVVRWIEGANHRAAVKLDTSGRQPLGTIEPATPATPTR